MKISKHTVVTIDYTLTDDQGEVLDRSLEGKPLHYIQGTGQLIPGLEMALEGKAAGDAVKARIPHVDAYGERDESLLQSVPREHFQGLPELRVGMELEAESDDGVRVITVVGIQEDQVTVDGNHPLAGMDLNFDVKVVEVRAATAEEIGHGHVHGPDGHHH